MFVHLLIAALTEQAMCLNEYYFDFWGSILLHAGFNGSILYVIIHVVVSATKMQYTNLILFNGIAKVSGTAGGCLLDTTQACIVYVFNPSLLYSSVQTYEFDWQNEVPSTFF